MSDQVFWDQLGLRPGAAREQIRRAYRRLARKHHPDIFPEGEKALQELKMIALNEAYAHLMRRRPAGRPSGLRHRGEAAGSSRQGQPASALAPHRDPAYVTYKQGFVHYSRALQGIEALYQQSADGRAGRRAGRGTLRSAGRLEVVHFRPRDDAYQRFAAGLSELRLAHEYFSRVVEDYGQSVWQRDAAVKLGRIARFTRLYRRILGNLGIDC